jgi:hypothetical protein
MNRKESMKTTGKYMLQMLYKKLHELNLNQKENK